ncbi:MAG: ATP-binding protein [Bacteroidales bacterium]|nr:ATP-binding protein [Bacteroidales bacterium]
MEKRVEDHNSNIVKRVVITGPESTGKTVLCEKLAKHYNTLYIPEYAREYVSGLDRKYTYEDVVYIAQKQVELEAGYAAKAKNVLFYDTYLVITKVWLEVVFNSCPEWITDILKQNRMDLYLVCAPDIPWIPDGVRENGGHMREVLFKRYISEIEHYSAAYRVISGEQRYLTAKGIIDQLLNKNTGKENG